MSESAAGREALAFEKYHGLGNDYLVLDGIGAPFPTPEAARRICDRSTGLGSDGILFRDPDPGGFALRILNPDGSEAEKSGNGLRIFARWLYDRGEAGDDPFEVRTAGGVVGCRVLESGAAVRVEMGRVRFLALEESIEVGGERLVYSAADIGNPHCVVFRDPLQEADLLRLGPLLEVAPEFPNRTNVQLAKVIDRQTLAIEIWERGAGHTRASGSSSCAAAAVAHRLGLCDARLSVVMAGGELAVEMSELFDLVQEGPVVRVASMTLDPEALR